MSRSRALLWLGFFAILTLIVFVVVNPMSVIDRVLVYHPTSSLSATPADVGLEYADVYLTASDGVRVHGWHIPGRSRITLLWFHGNSGNIGHRADGIALLSRHVGVGVFIIDYRGYGMSEGRPSEKGIYRDAEAALEYLIEEMGLDPEREIVLFGRSLGAGVAAEMAARYRVRGVVLESGFTSIRDMAKVGSANLFVWPIMRLMEARYDSLSKMSRIESPVMVIHGDRDDTIPYEMGERLYAAAPDPKRFYRVHGGSHNDTYIAGGEAYYDALSQFIADPAGNE